MATRTEHTALIYVMVLVSAADSNMADRELYMMGEIVRLLPAFRAFDQGQLPKVAEQCAKKLGKDGLDSVIAYVVRTLPPHLRETAYVLACDIAGVKGRLRSPEIKFLEFLRHSLGIGRLPAAAIERAAKARYQGLTPHGPTIPATPHPAKRSKAKRQSRAGR